jgi:hypothetical protein
VGQVTVKKNLVVFHDPADWMEILEHLARTYGNTIRMRHIMRRELGFTSRDHQGLEPYYAPISGAAVIYPGLVSVEKRHHYSPQVHLDFFTEAAHSWFQLKYLNRENQNNS